MGGSQLRLWMRWQHAGKVDDVVSPFPPNAPGSRIVPELEPAASEAILDKLTMSAFESTPLDLVLRDCGVTAVAMVGVALDVGIEPTARHAADLGYLPIELTDARAAGDVEAGERTLAALQFAGDALLTDVASFAAALQQHS